MAKNEIPGGYARPDDQGKKTVYKLVIMKKIVLKKNIFT